jgi:Family of unknown function (DUF5677)
MHPQKPDPIAAAHKTQRIESALRVLPDAFRRANRESKHFPDWREYQILALLTGVGLYVADLGETYRARRLDSLAQAMRNLMELNIWTQYCGASEQNAKQFYDDAARDMKEILESLQKIYTEANKEPQDQLTRMMADFRTAAETEFNVESFDGDYTRLNNAAGKVGKQSIHSSLYKIASKLAHPTSLLLGLNHSTKPDSGLFDSLYEFGAGLAVASISQVEKCIKNKYPELPFEFS